MRRTVLLLLAPAVMLGGVGVILVGSATAQRAAAAYGDPGHFAVRQAAALVMAAAACGVTALLGAARLLQAAPLLFGASAVTAAAVFAPGLGVRAAGAHRWLHVGPYSFAPAPLVALGVALLVSAWGRPAPRPGLPTDASGPLPTDGAGRLVRSRRRRAGALALAAGVILLLVAEPDFSAALVAGLAVVAALAGLGLGGRRLGPAALVVALVLAVVASRFGYVSGRMRGFFAPERHARGSGYEVLALERSAAATTATGAGLGHGQARRRLSSPGSDYVYAVIREELGDLGGGAVLGAWALVACAAALASRGKADRRMRALALGSGMALVAPAALHMAVCTGLLPIIGVSMPLVSYDPAATMAAGAEIGILASLLGARRDRAVPP